MHVAIKNPCDLEIKALNRLQHEDPQNAFVSISIEIPKYLFFDLLEYGVKFQSKQESTPNLFFVPSEWLTKEGKSLPRTGKLQNVDISVLQAIHKAYEIYNTATAGGMDPEMAKQLLPSSNIITAISTDSKVNWERIVESLLKTRREDLNHIGSKIRSLLEP